MWQPLHVVVALWKCSGGAVRLGWVKGSTTYKGYLALGQPSGRAMFTEYFRRQLRVLMTL